MFKDQNIVKSKQHCDVCLPDVAHNYIEGTINDFCEEATLGKEPAPRVYKKALSRIESNGWHLASNKPVPTFDQKKSAIYRQRNKSAQVTKTSTCSPEEIEVPEQYKDFLLADYFYNGLLCLA